MGEMPHEMPAAARCAAAPGIARRMTRCLCLASLAFTSLEAGAEDWYWRPDRDAPYGSGDGTTFANAWRRASEVRWQAMRPGDTLYFCGTHKNGGDDRQINVGAPAITISGACRNSPGVLWSTGRRLTEWVATGTAGVYATQYSGTAAQALNAAWKRLARLDAIPNSTSPCDSWFQSDRFYYKPCGAPVAVHPNGPPPAVLVSADDVTVQYLTVLNASRLVEVSGADRVTLRRLLLYHGDRQGIQITGHTRNGRILDSEVHSVGNGIVASTSEYGRHDGWVVEGNYVHDVAGSPGGDAHCVGWQNGNGNRISNNRLENCAGPALAIYWWNEWGPLRDNEWSYNQIESPANTGISISGTNCPEMSSTASNNVARGNLVQGGPVGFYVKVTPWSFTLLDNSVTGADVGLKWKFIDGGNAAGAPPPFIESGNSFNAVNPYLPPPASSPCA